MRELQASIINSNLPRQMAGKTNSGFEDEKGGAQGGGLLGVDNSALNSHTYVYDADKSLRKMTIEALPSPENYQVSRRGFTYVVRQRWSASVLCIPIEREHIF